MKFLFDLFPVILFFLVYKVGDSHQGAAHDVLVQYFGGIMSGGSVPPSQAPILLATAVAIVASVFQIGYLLARRRKVDGMLWVSLVVILVMGGATLYFHDENFIKWKPTILYCAFGVGLFVSQVFFGQNLMRKAMEQHVRLPEAVWARVGYSWIVFFTALGVLNYVVAFVIFRANTSAWVTFHSFGITAIFFVFVIVQTLLLSKHIQEEEA